MLLSAPIAFAKEHVVSQKGKQFAPEELTISAGDTIVFKNDDDTSHNVFATGEGSKFNLGIQKPATETRHDFTSPGEMTIRCAIHPKMKIKVVVK